MTSVGRSNDSDSLRLSDALHFRSCEDGLLVFDSSNGKTSLVSPQGAIIVEALSTEYSIGEEDILRILQQDNGGVTTEFDALVASLENSGLIIRC